MRTGSEALPAFYASGGSVHERLGEVHAAIDLRDPVWIAAVSDAALGERTRALDALGPAARAALPLFGLPFAVKDNIDVAGLPTTAGCPAFAYAPARSASVVERLERAGAVVLGKTNLDQFATGLVGTRSPYGVPANPFDPAYIPGGSSSGSAVAVARGFVSFALGTDTAGSGRVPAGFTGTIGVKPTHGIISAAGVVPACRSLDCVSIFVRTLDEAALILDVAAAPDARDPFSRERPAAAPVAVAADPARPFVFAVPLPEQRIFFGDDEARDQFERSIARLVARGGSALDVDLASCFEAAALLYDGPFVAERTAAVGDFVDAHPEAVLDVTRTIVQSGRRYSAVDTFFSVVRAARVAQCGGGDFRPRSDSRRAHEPDDLSDKPDRSRAVPLQFTPGDVHQFRQSARSLRACRAGRRVRRRSADRRNVHRAGLCGRVPAGVRAPVSPGTASRLAAARPALRRSHERGLPGRPRRNQEARFGRGRRTNGAA